MSIVRDQLHTLTIDSLTQAQLKSAAGPVFLDASQEGEQQTAVAIVDAHRAVHAPTYGVAIPGTGTINSAVGDSVGAIFTIHQPATGETFELMAADVLYTGGPPADVILVLTDGTSYSVVKRQQAMVGGSRMGMISRSPLFYDNSVYLGAIVEVGTANATTVTACSMKVVQ